jgi:hypothetical protein
MVTDYGRCPFDFLRIFLVVSSKILTVVNVNHLQASAATGHEQIEGAANVVEEIDQPFTASIFHWTFFEIMPNRQNPRLNIRLDKMMTKQENLLTKQLMSGIFHRLLKGLV